MKLGLIITTFERPEYLEKCLNSLRKSTIPKGSLILIVDDHSTDARTLQLINDFFIDGCEVFRSFSETNQGISAQVRYAYNTCFASGCTVAMNLDSDAIVRPDFITRILELKNYYPGHIVTGFHSTTKNRNGTERHPILKTSEKYCLKSSVGGINMCMSEPEFRKYCEPALNKVINEKRFNWDHLTCVESMKDGKGIVCTVPSVIQHIGFDSSMNHKEAPDVADDFTDTLAQSGTATIKFDNDDDEVDQYLSGKKKRENPTWSNSTTLNLPNVTLLTVNCDKLESGIAALEASQQGINFGAVKLLTSADTTYPHAVKIPHIENTRGYSEFIMKQLDNYVDTDYVLIVQSDGYVKNPAAWNPDWLQYDYIGATWWYKDSKNVGNGGFSLRSKKLCHITADDSYIRQLHPEDDKICRLYHDYLVRAYGIRFAPESVADKFSVEGYRQPHKQVYNGQFGFHGNLVKFLTTNEPTKAGKPTFLAGNNFSKELIIPNQFFGLGDILFCIPLIRSYIEKGHRVLWPVIKDYVSIGKHFPDITFIDKALLNIDYENRNEYTINGARVLPLRWTVENKRVPFKDCMKVKYTALGMDWRSWRNLKWERDITAETTLLNKVLSEAGLKPGEPYRLINRLFRSNNSGRANIPQLNGMANIEMKPTEGYTLLDWQSVMEGAEEVHSVSTASLYLFELLELKNPVHLYIRRPDEKNFDNVDYLIENRERYVFHR